MKELEYIKYFVDRKFHENRLRQNFKEFNKKIQMCIEWYRICRKRGLTLYKGKLKNGE